MVTSKNYCLFTGAELINGIGSFKQDFDILVETKCSPIHENMFLYQARILEFPNYDSIVVNHNCNYLFYNKILYTDPLVKLLFENRITDYYEFVIDQTEADYLHKVDTIIKDYQEFHDNDLGEKFISTILSQMVMYYKIIFEKMVGRDKVNPLSVHNHRSKADKFLELVAAHHDKERKISFYADMLSVCRRTLSNITKNVLGKTPKQIIDHHLIEKAKFQLTNRKLSIKEIGLGLGFMEPNHFSIFFRKLTNVSPKEFRNQNSV